MSHATAPSQRADLIGIACSAGCAAHCAALPVIASLSPGLGLGWFAGSLVHQIVALLCCVFVYKAIAPTWRVHRDHLVAGCVLVGLSLLTLAAFVLPDPCCEPTSVFGWLGLPLMSIADLQWSIGRDAAARVLFLQPYLTPIGGVLLIAAHVINLDYSRRCCSRKSDARCQKPRNRIVAVDS